MACVWAEGTDGSPWKRGCSCRVWIHEHTFKESNDGSEVRDFVRYAAPGGWLVDRLFVRNDVRRIIEYRTGKLQEIFVEKMRGSDAIQS